ncbi:tRNA (adenosine(37)-N6)-threonylcarbamoyltransferase complex ATPase subunit type 1 TsaE [Candidatus Parcubacteria bacterium]|nr:MAG: tRNA (adenosine(37)-N6)-threonylcarbamoyltransferase complex ATPase subunit type 1 TsaE [Candidatus Parcubacteria bacterium]
MRKYQSFSSKQTRQLGENFARRVLSGRPQKSATLVGLQGASGSGKTTFVQGFLRGLGTSRRTASPTFVIAKRVRIRKGLYRDFFHVDLYRLKAPVSLESLGFREALRDPRNIFLIEWADRAKRLLLKRDARLRFLHGKHPHERLISFR